VPILDNYLLDNYRLDGPGIDWGAPIIYSAGIVPNAAGTKSYTNLGFTPVFAVLRSVFSSGIFEYDISYVMARGLASPGYAAGVNNSSQYYNARMGATDVVFGNDSLSFTHTSSSYASVTLTIYGY
jgi:hypothetical protein